MRRNKGDFNITFIKWFSGLWLRLIIIKISTWWIGKNYVLHLTRLLLRSSGQLLCSAWGSKSGYLSAGWVRDTDWILTYGRGFLFIGKTRALTRNPRRHGLGDERVRVKPTTFPPGTEPRTSQGSWYTNVKDTHWKSLLCVAAKLFIFSMLSWLCVASCYVSVPQHHLDPQICVLRKSVSRGSLNQLQSWHRWWNIWTPPHARTHIGFFMVSPDKMLSVFMPIVGWFVKLHQHEYLFKWPTSWQTEGFVLNVCPCVCCNNTGRRYLAGVYFFSAWGGKFHRAQQVEMTPLNGSLMLF